MITFYEYPKCTTCRKGRKYLEEQNVEFESIDMVKTPPSASELTEIIDRSDRDVDDFFNKRGKRFKELGLKERLDDMSKEEKVQTLSEDGMLIKRPLLHDGSDVVLGFRAEAYDALLDA